jgi:predicted RNA-binding protein Jag
MELEENAAAAAEARDCACAEAPADEIKAVPMDAPADDAATDDAGFDAVDRIADGSADEDQGARARRTPQRPPVKPASPESMEEARSVLAHMLDFLGIEANVRVENKPRSVNLLVSSEEPGRVIGHHGQTLENLQLIVNRIMQKTDSEFPKLYIDMEGNRERRQERRERPAQAEGSTERRERGERGERRDRGERCDRGERREFRGERRDRDRFEGGRRSFSRDDMLRQQALDAAKEVRLFGIAKTLPPMNSHDRRIVHITLENEPGLCTDSQGDGENRSVVISLKEEVKA